MPLDAKSFDFGWPGLEVWEFKNIQIEPFVIQGHGPRLLKPSNYRFLNIKTSNSKLLTSWDHALYPKSFDLEAKGVRRFQRSEVQRLNPGARAEVTNSNPESLKSRVPKFRVRRTWTLMSSGLNSEFHELEPWSIQGSSSSSTRTLNSEFMSSIVCELWNSWTKGSRVR